MEALKHRPLIGEILPGGTIRLPSPYGDVIVIGGMRPATAPAAAAPSPPPPPPPVEKNPYGTNRKARRAAKADARRAARQAGRPA